MSDWKIRFGTAGTSDSFAAQGYKSSLDVPEYTAKMGLNAFEYQCGRGVRLGLDKAAKMAALAGPKDILFSVHAPYYISMSSLEEEKRLNSIQYLLQSAAVCKAAHWSRHWAAAGLSSPRAAAASRAGKRPLKKHWIPCAVPWKRWTKQALPI